MIVKPLLHVSDDLIADTAEQNLLNVGCKALGHEKARNDQRKPRERLPVLLDEDVVDDVAHQPRGEGRRAGNDGHEKECHGVARNVLARMLAEEALNNRPDGGIAGHDVFIPTSKARTCASARLAARLKCGHGSRCTCSLTTTHIHTMAPSQRARCSQYAAKRSSVPAGRCVAHAHGHMWHLHHRE